MAECLHVTKYLIWTAHDDKRRMYCYALTVLNNIKTFYQIKEYLYNIDKGNYI